MSSISAVAFQPVRHPQLSVHGRRGGEMRQRLLALARAPGELAEAGPRATRGRMPIVTSTLWTTRPVTSWRHEDQPCRNLRKRFHLDIALSQRQRLWRDHDRAGIRELLHPGG